MPTNLQALATDRTIYSTHYCLDGSDWHRIDSWIDPSLWTYNIFLIHFNLTTGEAVSHDMAVSGRFSGNTCQFKDGYYYTVTSGTGGVGSPKATYFYYNVRTKVLSAGEVLSFGGIDAQYPSACSDMSNDGSTIVEAISISDGANLHSYAWKINTATKAILVIGRISDTEIVYTDGTVCDENYGYFLMGGGTTGWIVIVNLTTGATYIPWEAGTLGGASVYHRSDGKIYASVKILPSGSFTYWLLNGTDEPVSVGSLPSDRPYWYTAPTGWVFDTSFLYPNNEGESILTFTRAGESTPVVSTASGVDNVPAATKVMRPYNNKLLCSVGVGGKTFTLDKDDNVDDTVFGHIMNTYDIQPDLFTNKNYYTGYTHLFYTHDRSLSWNLYPGQDPTTTNPKQIVLDRPDPQGEYFRKIRQDKNRVLWLVNDFYQKYEVSTPPVETDLTGSYLQWYDPNTTPATTAIIRGAHDPLQVSLSAYRAYNFQMMRSGRHFAFSTQYDSLIGTNDGVLFIGDCTRKVLVKAYTPVPGVINTGWIIEAIGGSGMPIATRAAASGKILGVVIGTPNTVYLLDIFRGVEWTATFSGTINAYGYSLWDDQILANGPDGYVWLFVDGKICRINPATGEKTVMVDSPVTHGRIIWWDNKLYIYFTSDLAVQYYTATELGI